METWIQNWTGKISYRQLHLFRFSCLNSTIRTCAVLLDFALLLVCFLLIALISTALPLSHWKAHWWTLRSLAWFLEKKFSHHLCPFDWVGLNENSFSSIQNKETHVCSQSLSPLQYTALPFSRINAGYLHACCEVQTYLNIKMVFEWTRAYPSSSSTKF